MSRYFMYGTSLGGIEQLMMLAPNFPQRRSGIVINNHFNCEGGIKSSKFSGELFLNHNHEGRFYHSIQKQDIDIEDGLQSYLAVIFLLTADEVLWNISETYLKNT